VSTIDQQVRRLVPVLAVQLFAAACVESAWTVCPGGRVCPPDLTCDPSNDTCADDACLGKAEGSGCDGNGGVCRSGQCRGSCGDGVANGADECDGTDFAGKTCASPGIDHYRGNLTCHAGCTVDSSTCSGYCGDGAHDQGFEVCDPTDFDTAAGESCFSRGFDAGRQGCARDCGSLSDDPCMRFGWVDEDPVPGDAGTRSIRDIWGTDDDLFVLVSPGGVRSRALGWVPVGEEDGVSIQGRALWASSSADIWVIDLAGDGFLHWDGTSWTEVASPAGGLNDIWGSSACDIFAVGDRGAAVHFDGESWKARTTPAGTGDLRVIWGVGPNEVYAAGEGGTLVGHDGTAWSAIASGTSETLIAVWASSRGDIWTISDTTVRRFDGDRWTAMLALDGEPGGPGWVPGRAWMSGTGSSEIWISAGRPGGVRRYDGARWWTLLAGDATGPQPLWVARPSVRTAAPQVAVGFQSGSGHGIVRLWYGAGVGPKLDIGHGPFNDVWAAEPDTWVAVGAQDETFQHGLALHSDGRTFRFELPLVRVAGLRSDRVFAADDGGTIFAWDGAAWSETRAGELEFLGDLWTSGSSDVYAALDELVGEGAVRVIHFDGKSWTDLPAPGSCGISATGGWASSPEDVFLVGQDVLAHFDGSAWSCFDDPGVENFYKSVWGSGPGDVWVAEMTDSFFPDRLHHWNGEEWTTQPLDLGQQLPFFITGELIGTAADDVFLGNIAHYDGRTWLPVPQTAWRGLPVFALRSRLFTLDAELTRPGLGQFIRTRFWSPHDHELDCGDGIDDDADGLTDRDDDDCQEGPRLAP